MIIDEPRKTVGAAALELMVLGDQRQGVIDTQREMQKGYINQLVICAKNGEIAYGKTAPYYICVQTRRERLLTNVIRNQFYHRLTRPIPQYDLALYHYDPRDENLQFVWCIPDRETVMEMSAPGFQPVTEQLQLYHFVKSFRDNTLI